MGKDKLRKIENAIQASRDDELNEYSVTIWQGDMQDIEEYLETVNAVQYGIWSYLEGWFDIYCQIEGLVGECDRTSIPESSTVNLTFSWE